MPTGKPATLYTALVAAQMAMGPVLKDKINPAFKSRYADLDAVLDAVRGPLNENGLALLQPLEDRDGRLILRTVIVHGETGEAFESSAEVRCADMDNPQKVGGALTYMRRYSLLALLGIAPEDDDGQMASQPRQQPQPRNAPVTRPEPPGQAQPPQHGQQGMSLDDEVIAGFYTSIAHATNEKEVDKIMTEMRASRLTDEQKKPLMAEWRKKKAAYQATS